MSENVNEILYLQFNRKIVKAFKDEGIFADDLGSAMITLYALREGKLGILEELDDASNAKRMLYLYQTLLRRGLIEEESKSSYSYYRISSNGSKLLDIVDKEFNDEVVEPVVATTPVIATKEPENDAWMLDYIALFPKERRCHHKVIIERFEKFKKNFPEYFNANLILKATLAYLKSMQQSGSEEFIRMAHYFVWKSENGGTTYDLATWCDRVSNKPDSPATNDYNTEFLNLA